MLKQETFYEVQSWGCVSALLGLPAELNPQMSCFVPDDVCNYTSQKGDCQQLFWDFLQKNSRRGNALPGGKNDREKTYALAFCRSKICGATRIRITTRTVVRMASGSM